MLQDLNLQELSFEETIQIDAGGETAYNIGKALGKGAMLGFTMIGVIGIIMGG
ncbi:hypothetical protein [Chishuiella sp.]|uniref:hypothetical protein n=1 Tax=Chishuiella sp. TaxID=1969467 RepID=UPI0028AC30B6|nr:hypothetical protein [Chishuiella sp.]